MQDQFRRPEGASEIALRDRPGLRSAVNFRIKSSLESIRRRL